ncbi:MAG: hypothetical protein IRY83_02925 [Chloroflexi bacterium]|nr:hypothetical protein [Chloroflexota bacterium]HLG50011.1 hypothetical protein [Chloroflexota bacterium]
MPQHDMMDDAAACQDFAELAAEIDRALMGVTPRAAAVTLLLFDRVVARYERETGRHLSDIERETVLAILRHIVRKDAYSIVPPI